MSDRKPSSAEMEEMIAILRNGGTLLVAPDLAVWCAKAGITIDGTRVRVSDWVPSHTMVAVARADDALSPRPLVE